MAYGLQVFDGSGNLEVDVSSRLTRYVTTITLTVPADHEIHTYAYNIPGITTDGNYSFTISSNLNAAFFITTPLSKAALQPYLSVDTLHLWAQADFYIPIQVILKVFTL